MKCIRRKCSTNVFAHLWHFGELRNNVHIRLLKESDRGEGCGGNAKVRAYSGTCTVSVCVSFVPACPRTQTPTAIAGEVASDILCCLL